MSEEFPNEVSQETGAEAYSIAEDVLREPTTSEYDAPPQSWKREVSERHWSKLDPELRGYLHTREADSHGQITKQGQRLKELEAAAQRAAELESVATRYQPIDGIFERYRPYIPEGLAPEHAIEALLNVQQLISTPETREQAFAHLVQSCGINPMALLPPQMREQIETAQRELQSAKQADVQRTLDEFTKDKSYYPEIRENVIKEILEIRRGAPGLDNATVLKLAHDRVVERTGITNRLEMEAKAKEFEEAQKREAEQAKARREEEVKRVKAAKRAAGVNVKSSPAAPAPRTMDDDLRAIARKHYGVTC